MKKKKPAKNDEVYIFRVTLSFDSPVINSGKNNLGILKGGKAPWREISILGKQSLYDFAEAINDAFGFAFDHCFGFFDNINDMYKSQERYELFNDTDEPVEGSQSVEKNAVKKAFPNIGKKMLFYFDYGDGWEFIVKLENIKEAEIKKAYPILLSSFGHNPEQYPDYEE